MDTALIPRLSSQLTLFTSPHKGGPLAETNHRGTLDMSVTET